MVAKAKERTAAKLAPPWANVGPVRQVAVGLIDPSPAAAVRAGSPDPEYVAGLVAAYETDHPPPPVQVFAYPDGGRTRYLLGDGGNRLAAHKAGGVPRIAAHVVACDSKGDAEREAFAFALRANDRHGRRRTNEDLRAAVRTALARPEYAGVSDRGIDGVCGASPGYTSRFRKDGRAGPDASAPPHARKPRRPARATAPAAATDGTPSRAAVAAPFDAEDAGGNPGEFPWDDGRLALAWLIPDDGRDDGHYPPVAGHWHGHEYHGGPVAVRCWGKKLKTVLGAHRVGTADVARLEPLFVGVEPGRGAGGDGSPESVTADVTPGVGADAAVK